MKRVNKISSSVTYVVSCNNLYTPRFALTIDKMSKICT